MKRLGLLAKGALLGALMLGAAASPSPSLHILQLEHERSLNDGSLAQLLDSRDQRVAVRAALAIGRTKRAAGEDALEAHLSDPRPAVRAMCVYAIGLLATGQAADRLPALLADPNSAVRVAALDAVARYEAAKRFGTAETTAQTAVAQSLGADSDAVVRARAATALVEFSDAPTGNAAAAALAGAFRHDTDEAVRWHAMWSIYRGYATLVDKRTIVDALHDRDELVRIEAVRAMARLKGAGNAALVAPLLDDPSWRVQEQAGETIRILDGKPPMQHWTSIPPYVHVPAPAPDPYAKLAPLPWPRLEGKPAAPQPDQAIFQPALDPTSAFEMTEPAAGLHPRVRIVTTKGDLYVALYPEWAPLTVANFLNLAARGYYNGNRWFRIVPDFVVQTGDPHDNGEGDAGYTIGAEENPLEQRSYVISMGLNYDDKTNTPIRDSAGSQYYVTLSPQLHLDRDFTVFGAVVSGFDVLGRLIESDRVIRIERLADIAL